MLRPCFGLAMLLAAASGAHAQDAPPPEAPAPERAGPPATADADAPPAEVQALLERAVAAYDEARYDEALAAFERAHALWPTARTLRSIGMAAFESDRHVQALQALRASLDEERRALTAEQREHVLRLIARTEPFVAVLELDVRPATATVLIDGAPATAEADGTVLLPRGAHTVTAVEPGGRGRRLDVELVGGTRRRLIVRLDTLSEGGPDPLVVTGVTLLGAGVLATAAAIVTGVLASDAAGELEASCRGFVCPGVLRPTQDRARDLALATDVTGGGAALAMAVGVVLLIASTQSSAPPPVSLACGPTGCAVAVEGRF